jgi:hypothetical protein
MDKFEDVEWNEADGGYEIYLPKRICSYGNKLITAFIRSDADVPYKRLYDLYIRVPEKSGNTLYMINANQRDYQCTKIIRSLEQKDVEHGTVQRV